MQASIIDGSTLHRGPTSEKENHELPPEKQSILASISVNASATYLNRSEANNRGLGKSRTDSFARHKAQKLEIRFSDFYKSKKEFKLVQDDERRFLVEDLYETDKCYYFASAKIEIHAKVAEGILIRRTQGRPVRTLGRPDQVQVRGFHGDLAPGCS